LIGSVIAEKFQFVDDFIISMLITSPRIASAFVMIPFFSKQMIPGAVVKNGIIFAIVLYLMPIHAEVAKYINLFGVNGFSIVLKEVFVGMVIGFMVTIPFWAIESVGFFIDNQRGATMASSLNPLTGSQTSPLGILLNQALTTMFFSSGAFLLFIIGLYNSYLVWPLLDYFPTLDLNLINFFIDQITYLLFLTVMLASPIIVAMFMSEFCFALVNRFTPQLNVFILSMSVKSAVGIFLMIFYVQFLFGYLGNELKAVGSAFERTMEVLVLQ